MVVGRVGDRELQRDKARTVIGSDGRFDQPIVRLDRGNEGLERGGLPAAVPAIGSMIPATNVDCKSMRMGWSTMQGGRE